MRIDVDFHANNMCLDMNIRSGRTSFDMGFDSTYVIDGGGRGGLPAGGNQGDIILKSSDVDYDAEWAPPATSPEEHSARPITAGAVYDAMSEIDFTLATAQQINHLF